MSQSLVRHFMTSPVATVAPDAPLQLAAHKMFEKQISCVVVFDNDGPVGILTERDITRTVAAQSSVDEKTLVSDIMTTGLMTLNVDAACSDALRMLKERKIRRCVIVDSNEELRGVITQTDLLHAHARDIELQKQVLEDRVSERTAELQHLNKRLEVLSLVDPMLEIGNRRAMDIALNQLHSRTLRSGVGYALALIDIDFFKTYNDHYGHIAGDEALKKVVDNIKQNIRVADSLYRYGGEEFLIIFPDESLEDAAISAERVRKGIEEAGVEHTASDLGTLTVSIGVASLSEPNAHWESVIRAADNALYKAKHVGKNRIETFESEGEFIASKTAG